MTTNNSISGRLRKTVERYGDHLPIFTVLGVLCLIIFPLPTPVLDVALALNLTLSVLILALSIYVPHALHLSTFPTLLLVTTLFRLGLNIASTRQILLNGYAGEIITTFGRLVVGGNVIVGFVIFIIIAIIQFVVIAKGSDRVAEVGARFSLDALPGKQMAIDADLRAGMLTKADALERRRQLEQTSQFYGAMDGASKFVKGDAIAGLLIALINVIGGILIGSAVNGHPLAETARLYTVLTVGDGLVSQIPSLLISFASGILITRVASIDSETSVGADIGKQIAAQPKAMMAAAVVAVAFSLVPGFPLFAFLGVGILLASAAILIPRLRVTGNSKAQLNQHWARRDGSTPGDVSMSLPLHVRVAPALLNRFNALELDRRLLALRERFCESGVPYPGLRLSGDSALEASNYAIDIDEVMIARGSIAATAESKIGRGIQRAARSAVSNESAAGVEKMVSGEAELVDAVTELVCRKPWHFLGIQETSYLQEGLSRHFPQLVQLLSEKIPLFLLRDVLVELLKSNISIRNLRAIAEGLTKGTTHASDFDGLVAAARNALASQISNVWCDVDKSLSLVVLSPALEAFLRRKLIVSDRGKRIDLHLNEHQRFSLRVVDGMRSVWQHHKNAVLITGHDLRSSVEELLRSSDMLTAILAVDEISDDVGYRIVHTIEVDDIDTELE
jgi:type III secretion protein V